MAKRERRMCMNDVNRLVAVQVPHFAPDSGVEQSSGPGETQRPRHLGISHPLRGSGRTFLFSGMVDGAASDHAGVNSQLPELFERFRHKATADVVASRWKERRQGQNMQHSTPTRNS